VEGGAPDRQQHREAARAEAHAVLARSWLGGIAGPVFWLGARSSLFAMLREYCGLKPSFGHL
jgi:hypothetical protein